MPKSISYPIKEYLKINFDYNVIAVQGIATASLFCIVFLNETKKDIVESLTRLFRRDAPKIVLKNDLIFEFLDFKILTVKNTISKIADPIAKIHIFGIFAYSKLHW